MNCIPDFFQYCKGHHQDCHSRPARLRGGGRQKTTQRRHARCQSRRPMSSSRMRGRIIWRPLTRTSPGCAPSAPSTSSRASSTSRQGVRRTSRSSFSPTAGRRFAPSRTALGSAFPVSSLTTRAERQRPPCSVNTLHCVKSAIRRMTRTRWCSTSSPVPSQPSLPPLVIRQSRCSSNEIVRSISAINCFLGMMDEEKSPSRCGVVQTYGN